MRKFIVMILFLAVAGFVSAQEVFPLPEVMKPTDIEVSGKSLYIAEGTQVHIYSLPDFKYLKKVGGKGQGPGEFPYGVQITTGNNELYVYSFGKVGVYTSAGDYIREIKNSHFFFRLYPVGDGFVGNGSLMDPELGVVTGVSVYNPAFKSLKTIFVKKRIKTGGFDRGQMEVLGGIRRIDVLGDIIVQGISQGTFSFKFADLEGKVIKEIKKDIKRIRISPQFKDEYTRDNELMRGGPFKGQKMKLLYPAFFPPFQDFICDKKQIYLIGYTGTYNEWMIQAMDLEGNINDLGIVEKPNLYDIKNGVFYGLTENLEDESWEIRMVAFR